MILATIPIGESYVTIKHPSISQRISRHISPGLTVVPAFLRIEPTLSLYPRSVGICVAILWRYRTGKRHRPFIIIITYRLIVGLGTSKTGLIVSIERRRALGARPCRWCCGVEVVRRMTIIKIGIWRTFQI